MKKMTIALAALAAALLAVGGAVAGKPGPAAPVTIQILNVSDWHGNVDPVANIGGAWNISARWKADRQAYPSLTLTAGDDFGATPAIVNFFNEEPSVKAQRLMGIQVGTFGNHNFDRGVGHLSQMIALAGAPTSTAAPGEPYRYTAANLRAADENLGDGAIDKLSMFDVGGAKVAVIGIVNEEAPGLVLPGSFGTITVTDGVEAANHWAKVARNRGANAVVVITHKGVRGFSGGQPFGELIDFANAVEGVDVIIGDHTDVQYSGTINGTLVHENRSFGVTYAKTLLTLQPGKDGGVLSKSVSFVSPSAGALTNNSTQCPAAPAFCDQAIVDMLVPYRQALAAKLDETVGTTTLPFDRGGNLERRQEVPLGDLIADGMRWRYGTQLGLMNSGGIRSQMPTCSYQPTNHALKRSVYAADHTTVTTCSGYASGGPYDIVLGDIFTVLPFGNILNTRTVTGAQLWTAMENGVSQINSVTGLSTDGRFPQISGFKFTFHYGNPAGSRVTSMQLDDGTPIPNSSTATYTMALPNFVNLGGDGYAVFNDGQGATQELDAVVMKEYMNAVGPSFDPASYPLNRVTKLP
jgi:5'-nucleotidase